MHGTHAHSVGVGEVIDNYVLEAVVAAGVTSTTFRARDQRLGRTVALKLLHAEAFLGDAGARERAVGDAVLAASLEHPAIIAVFGAGQIGDGLWVASAYADGLTLADVVQQDGITPEHAVDALARVADALDCAHAAGAVHRELRPECIVFDRWRHPLIRDFGVTRLSGRTGLATRLEFLDTLRYAAPELMLGRGATPATDVYGLAATAAWCLTGAHPFPDLPIAQLVALRADAPPPVLVAPVGAVAGLNAALAAGMAVEPSQRPSSAADLVAMLRHAVRDLPQSVREAPSPFSADGAGAPRRIATSTPGQPLPGGAPPAPPAPPAGATRVDRRREPEPEEASGPGKRPWATLVSLALAVIAVVAGTFAVGRFSAPKAPDPVLAGPIEVVPGEVWQRADASRAPPVVLRDAMVLSLRGRPQLLATVGVMAQPGAPGDPISDDVRGAFQSVPRPILVRAGERMMVRYRGTLSTGTDITLFVLPTTAGALTVACGDVAAQARCAALVQNARLGSARPVVAQPPAAAIETLAAALQKLSKGRGIEEIELNSKDGNKAAASALRLGALYEEFAESVNVTEVDKGTQVQLERLGKAAVRAAGAYEELSNAIDQRRPAKYASARADARRYDGSFAGAVARLTRAGYTVTGR